MALYLFPVPLVELGEQVSLLHSLPAENLRLVRGIRHFVVEEVRTARRWLRKMDKDIDIDALTFYPIGKHGDKEACSAALRLLQSGVDVGVLSEAGCPAIADPGAEMVRMAQEKGIRVVPLVGPSSILLSLMASGFNGQSFAFNGYLPIAPDERHKRLRELEQRAIREQQTQIFIETPFRNDKLVEEMLAVLRPTTLLCIAADLTSPAEYIATRSIAEWKRAKATQLPSLHKRPTIFLIHHA